MTERVTARLLADAVARSRAASRGEPVEPLDVLLRDGSTARLRPIRADDKDGLRRSLSWLSPRSRFLRFHHPLEHLTDEQLRYVTEVDHRDHVAWIALDPGADEPPGVAIARYVRNRHLPAVAEAAITVVDAYQGRGLGTILLGVLTAVAADNGIEVFRSYVLADNAVVLALFDELGASRQPLTSDVYEVDLLLPADLDELAASALGRTLAAVASAATPTGLALTMPPVWTGPSRRRDRRVEAPRPEAPAAPAWSSLRERGPFADWLDAALGDQPEHEVPPDADAAGTGGGSSEGDDRAGGP